MRNRVVITAEVNILSCSRKGEGFMRKNFGAKPFMYPLPVLIVASYDEEGIPNAMNAAWGTIADFHQVAIYLAKDHKTTQNILKIK